MHGLIDFMKLSTVGILVVALCSAVESFVLYNARRKLRLRMNDGSPSLLDFLVDSQKLGFVRFVVVGSGAILEAVGTFDNLSVSQSTQGKLATVSLQDPCFECHIRLDEVKQVQNLSGEKFGKLRRVTKFKDGSGKTVLSAILHDESERSIAVW